MAVNQPNYQVSQLLGDKRDIDKPTLTQWLCHCINRPLSFIISHPDYILSQAVYDKFAQGIEQLSQGVPLAYVIGSQGFWQHEFIVNEHTLIPRPDTEILVETVLTLIRSSKNSLSKKEFNHKTLLDLGTGSGCIGISLAKELKDWQITAIDKSDDALAIAKLNAKRLAASNINFLQSDWYQGLNSSGSKQYPLFDIIVSNPPYIAPQDSHLTDLSHEPIAALVADNQGLADIMTIVQGSGAWLNPHGILAIEHGYDQGEQVRAIFVSHGFSHICTVQDYGGNDRVTYGYHNSR